MSSPYQTIINVPTYKNYYVTRIPFRDKSIYNGDVEWVANWFYNNIEIHTDNILIEITGDFHQTFPNPPHLSIRFNYNKSWTPMYHISVDPNGFIYAQVLNSDFPYSKDKAKAKSKSKRKSKKRKSKKKRSKKRKSKKKRSKKGKMDLSLSNYVWSDPEPVPVPAPEPEPELEPALVSGPETRRSLPIDASPRLDADEWGERLVREERDVRKEREARKSRSQKHVVPSQGKRFLVEESMGPTRSVIEGDTTRLNIQVTPNIGKGATLNPTQFKEYRKSLHLSRYGVVPK